MSLDMLIIFLPLIIGYLIKLRNKKLIDLTNKICVNLVYIILFIMGVGLASLDNLGQNINSILSISGTFIVCISLCNLSILPILDKIMPFKSEFHHAKLPLLRMLAESFKLLGVVIIGVIAGLIIHLAHDLTNLICEIALYILLFFIGLQLRSSNISLRQILLNKYGVSIAVFFVFSSSLGGIIAALFLSIPLNQGLAISSGFGWYSLTGILVGDALGPIWGSTAFMVDLMRELIAIVLIPLLIKNYACTAIGYGGATALDFTLPVIQKSGGINCVPIAIVSGFILSLLVPFLVLFWLSF